MENRQRRRSRRGCIRIPVQCRGAQFCQYLEARDISCEGIFVAAAQLEPVGARLEVVFELPESQRKFVRVEATVSWVRPEPCLSACGDVLPSGMGLKFCTSLPLTAREYIERAIGKQSPV